MLEGKLLNEAHSDGRLNLTSGGAASAEMGRKLQLQKLSLSLQLELREAQIYQNFAALGQNSRHRC